MDSGKVSVCVGPLCYSNFCEPQNLSSKVCVCIWLMSSSGFDVKSSAHLIEYIRKYFFCLVIKEIVGNWYWFWKSDG